MDRARTSLGFLFISITLAAPLFAADDGGIIFDMDSIRHRPTDVDKDGKKLPAATAQLVEGRFGKAVNFSFIDGARGGFMVAPVRADKAWNEADGFSFWVKGDGSQSWGGIELIDRDNFRLRYGYCFPIDSTEWKKIVVPWRDLIPELAAPLISANGGYAPAGFGNFWFGKWFYWRDYPAHSFAIDQLVLEKKIDAGKMPDVPAGLARVRQKLKSKQPITVVTMGDSLTDERHWANREVVWHKLLARSLQEKFGGEVRIINPAMGGTTLSQNMIVMPKWLKDTPRPDLVIVWFGYNDWDAGIRGPRFSDYLGLAVDRIRRMTSGSADVMLVTTCPAFGRWETMRELEDAVRQVAKEKATALADPATEFRKAGSPEEAIKRAYWARDKTHLGKQGHELVSEVIAKAIATAD